MFGGVDRVPGPSTKRGLGESKPAPKKKKERNKLLGINLEGKRSYSLSSESTSPQHHEEGPPENRHSQGTSARRPFSLSSLAWRPE